jgi:hypothetical protein
LFACVQAAFQAVVKQYIEHEIVQVLSLEQVAAKSFGMAETKAAIEWDGGTLSDTWKLSSDGWMRELEIKAKDSHLLTYYAVSVWNNAKKKPRAELKKKQEQELRKRAAEGQPDGTAERGEAWQAGLTGR